MAPFESSDTRSDRRRRRPVRQAGRSGSRRDLRAGDEILGADRPAFWNRTRMIFAGDTGERFQEPCMETNASPWYCDGNCDPE